MNDATIFKYECTSSICIHFEKKFSIDINKENIQIIFLNLSIKYLGNRRKNKLSCHRAGIISTAIDAAHLDTQVHTYIYHK